MWSTSLLVFGLMALALFWAVGAYNRLIRLRAGIAKAFALLDLQLKERYALIAQLVDAARSQSAHEPVVLGAVIAASGQAQAAAAALRSQPLHAAQVLVLGMAEQVLTDSLGYMMNRLHAPQPLAGAQRKASAELALLAEQWIGSESRLDMAREGYNAAIARFNAAVRQFPALLLARVVGMAPCALLQAAPAMSPSKFGELVALDGR